MHAAALTWAALLLAAPGWAQSPSDVSLTLATQGGRTQFRRGEVVEMELRFQSTSPGKYQAWTNDRMRTGRVHGRDRFTADPAAGTADPLADTSSLWSGEASAGPIPLSPLGGTPVVVTLCLNEWISFRQPGKYRVTVASTRVVGRGTDGPLSGGGAVRIPDQTIPLSSNALDIEIIEAEPGWAAERLKEAVAVLEGPEPPLPRIGQVTRGPNAIATYQTDTESAARVLRVLETPEAAVAMVRLFRSSGTRATSQLSAGLWATPHRKETIAAMDQAVADPDFPITSYFLGALTQLKTVVSIGPITGSDPAPSGAGAMSQWMREVQTPYRARAKPVEDEVRKAIGEASRAKRGEALAITSQTLANLAGTPSSSATVKSLVENFSSLPEVSQNQFLTSNWPRFGSPAMEPTLRSLAEGGSLLRDVALARLREMNPEAARKITLDRIRRGDVSRDAYHEDRVLMDLPDQTLPEMDDALAGMLEQGRYGAEMLLARYASQAVYPRIGAFMDRRPLCSGPLFAYLFRVDASAASERLARLRSGSRYGCTLAGLSPNEDLLMSPGLEKQAIDDLRATGSPQAVRSAQMLLQEGGSADAKPALMAAMLARREAASQPDNLGVEFGFTEALLSGAGWVLTSEEIDQVLAACATDTCRQRVTSVRRSYQQPLQVSSAIGPSVASYARVGPYSVRSRPGMERKIAQFPKGTKFYLPPAVAGSWFGERRTAEIRGILEAAGMEIVAQAPR